MNIGYHILFDFDGVIARMVNFAKAIERNYGIPERKLTDFFSRYLESCLRGEHDLIELLNRNLVEIGWKGTAQTLFDAIYIETLNYNVELMDFIKLTIKHPNQSHIATNQDYHRYNLIRTDVELKPYFGHVFSSCEFGISKPHLNYYDKIYQALSTSNEHMKADKIILVDDLEENVEGAEHYGFNAHLFQEVESFVNYYNHLMAGNIFPKLRVGKISLDKMKLSHAKSYSDLLSDAMSHKYLTESGAVSEGLAKEKIIRNRNLYDTGDSIYWSIQGELEIFLGYIAVHNYNQKEVSISFGIHPAYRRQGLATLGLKTVLDWEGLYGKTVRLATHKENTASYQMLSKMNLSYQGFQSTKFGERHIFTNEVNL